MSKINLLWDIVNEAKIELERLNGALQTAENSLAEVQAQMLKKETEKATLLSEVDALRRANEELKRRLESPV